MITVHFYSNRKFSILCNDKIEHITFQLTVRRAQYKDGSKRHIFDVHYFLKQVCITIFSKTHTRYKSIKYSIFDESNNKG